MSNIFLSINKEVLMWVLNVVLKCTFIFLFHLQFSTEIIFEVHRV